MRGWGRRARSFPVVHRLPAIAWPPGPRRRPRAGAGQCRPAPRLAALRLVLAAPRATYAPAPTPHQAPPNPIPNTQHATSNTQPATHNPQRAPRRAPRNLQPATAPRRIQNLAGYSVSIIGAVFIGRLGPLLLSASFLANSFYNATVSGGGGGGGRAAAAVGVLPCKLTFYNATVREGGGGGVVFARVGGDKRWRGACGLGWCGSRGFQCAYALRSSGCLKARGERALKQSGAGATWSGRPCFGAAHPVTQPPRSTHGQPPVNSKSTAVQGTRALAGCVPCYHPPSPVPWRQGLSIAMGLSAGLETMCGQAYGAGDYKALGGRGVRVVGCAGLRGSRTVLRVRFLLFWGRGARVKRHRLDGTLQWPCRCVGRPPPGV